MDRDDPFGEADDLDKTIRRPRPGGRPAPAAPSPTTVPPTSAAATLAAAAALAAGPRPATPPPQRRATRRAPVDETVENAFSVAALNPITGAASALLWLASRINDSLAPDDVEELRDRVIAEMRRFEDAAHARGVAAEMVRVSRYALAATIDDVIMHTEWGAHSMWATRGLVSTLYNETLGGERFFDILDQMMADPNANADVLELMAICIAIGFTGKYRIMPAGMTQLDRLRDELHRTLRRVRGSYEHDLSAAWQGLSARHRPPASSKTVWAVCIAAVALLAVAYAAFSMTLRAASDVAIARINALIPVEMPLPPPPKAPEPPPPPKPAPAPKPLTQIERIQAALNRDIAAGLVQVIENADTIVLRVPGRDLFASAKITVNDRFLPVLRDIAAALEHEPGDIKVIGYADNVPIKTPTIASNLELSQRRAQEVLGVIATGLSKPDRLSAEGRGDADPIATNDTPEGRMLNRRIEIVIPRAEGQ
jgi:type VI secretion system protein ImpK